MQRSCNDCANQVYWEEYGHHCADCAAEPAASSVWRERLMDWGIDPARFCDQFVYVDHAAAEEAYRQSVIEGIRLSEEYRRQG